MIEVSWFILTIAIGLIFLFIWVQDFRRAFASHSKIGAFFSSYKFRETVYFSLIISIPVLFVNYSGLDGLFYHSDSVLLISSILIAFAISFVWFLYLNRLDHFEKEPIKTILLTFVLGSIFTFLVFPLSDFVQETFHFTLNGELWNDWWYCVIGIGLVEEIVKIIPFLIILKFSKQVNEPFDYIFYGSISALGFAFIENIIYLDKSFLTAIYGRALFASVAHMFFTSIITYGLIYFKYTKVNLKGFELPLLLLLAATAHGFYDFWLINDTASYFNIFTTFFLLLSIYFWATMINNTLNISPFYSLKVKFNKERVKYRLVNLLITTFYFAYVVIFFLNDKEEANFLLIRSWDRYVFVLLFLAFNLSNMELMRGFISKVTFKNRFLFILPNIHANDNFAGKNVHLSIPVDMRMRSGKEFLRSSFPVDAYLIQRVSIKGNSDCYLIKTERPLNVSGIILQHFVLKLISKGEEVFNQKPHAMVLYGLKVYPEFEHGIIPDKDIVFLHELIGVEIK